MAAGQVIRFQAQISIDDRTEQRRLTGAQIKELKARRKKTSGILELTLWTGRHNGDDLQKIKVILAEYPGKVPVHMHFQSGSGNRATMELPETMGVKMIPALERELAPWRTV
jgi:DNA polymerase-3 subunit alpha